MRRFQEVVEEPERLRAEADIQAWGYPRELVEGEREHSIFVRYGHDLLFWLNSHGDTGLAWHIVIDPHSRGRFTAEDVDRYFYGLDAIAQLLGATYLQAVLKPELKQLRNYCARRGWRENGDGYIRLLGEDYIRLREDL